VVIALLPWYRQLVILPFVWSYAALLLLGCSAVSPASPTAPAAVGLRSPVRLDGNATANAPLPASAAGDSLASHAWRIEPPKGNSERGPLTLLRDEGVLNSPLPAPSPGGYAAWRETSRINVGKSHLSQVALLPSGQLVVMSEREATIRVYAPTSKRLTANCRIPGFAEFDTGTVLAWPGVGERFVVGGKRGLMLFDAANGTLQQTFDERPLSMLRWSPDMRYLVALGAGATKQSSVLHFFERTAADGLIEVGRLDFEQRVDAWDLSADNRLLALSL
jgi:hypothetical protein